MKNMPQAKPRPAPIAPARQSNVPPAHVPAHPIPTERNLNAAEVTAPIDRPPEDSRCTKDHGLPLRRRSCANVGPLNFGAPRRRHRAIAVPSGKDSNSTKKRPTITLGPRAAVQSRRAHKFLFLEFYMRDVHRDYVWDALFCSALVDHLLSSSAGTSRSY